MFLLLYVAETTSPNLRGFYIGKQTYVLDLRKMLPSTFLRPCSQQGWIIKPKKNKKNLDDRVACIIRLKISLAKKLLGKGLLLTENNLFPSANYDQGYKVLLNRQKDSCLKNEDDFKGDLLPPNMISEIYAKNN